MFSAYLYGYLKIIKQYTYLSMIIKYLNKIIFVQNLITNSNIKLINIFVKVSEFFRILMLVWLEVATNLIFKEFI